MTDEKIIPEDENYTEGGYQPIKEGYKPIEGNLDPNDPPTGGSGLPNLPVTGENTPAIEPGGDESTEDS